MTSPGAAANERTLVVATTNRGKLAELRALLQGWPVRVVSSAEVLLTMPIVVEDQPTFAGNALKKASTVARATGMLALGDDSGLEVDALAGRPGVRSARYAHEHATDEENNVALLAALADVPDHQRSARFRCVLALALPTGQTATVEGACEGHIARAPRGVLGFGYDPLFVVQGGTRTMAELGSWEKNAVSHRGRALAALHPILHEWLDHARAPR